MGLQYITSSASSLFQLGIYQIIGFMTKRRNILDDVFSDFFINSDTLDGWEKIKQVIEPHGLAKLIPTGATPS